MKKKAEFTDDEARLIELLVSNQIPRASVHIVIDEAKYRQFRNNLTSIRHKCWAQLHGTCAADVEGV